MLTNSKATSSKEHDAPTIDTKKEDIDAKAAELFELRDLNAPVMSGLPLRIMTRLLESPLLGFLLRRRIFFRSGFTAFCARPASPDDDATVPCTLPIHYPLPQPGAPAQFSHINDLFRSLAPRNCSAGSARPTIRDYHDAYRSGRLTPLQVMRRVVDLIAESNSLDFALNAVADVNAEDILREARESSERWQAGCPLSVLDGVPYTVKNSLDVAGYATSSGSGFPDDLPVRTEDCDVVRALRSAGMVMVGKCNMDELGLGVSGFSMYTGQIYNPHNKSYVPGGSSGGCAASVAVGLCPVSIGSDAGGSIRIPAACCGVFGIKATFARISTHGRAISERKAETDEVSPASHIGPIASCAEDLALIYYTLAAFAPHRRIPGEPSFVLHPAKIPKCLGDSIEGLRIGVCLPWLESASQLGYSRTRAALDRMVANGAIEVPVIIPNLEDSRVSLSVSLLKSFLHALKKCGAYHNGSSSVIGYIPRGKLAIGEQFTEDDLERAKKVRTKLMVYCVEKLFAGNALDVLVTPSLGIETPAIPGNLDTGLADVNMESKMMKFSIYGNSTGIPCCTVPVGKDDETKLPFAIQVMAAPWKERILLEFALWAEREFGPHRSLQPVRSLDPLAG